MAMEGLMLKLTILFLALEISRAQHIFPAYNGTCQYKLDSTPITVPNRTWNVTYSSVNLIFTLCANKLPECNNEYAACILDKTDATKYLAASFDKDEDEFSQPILKSVGGAKCIDSPNSNYSVIVRFECSPYAKGAPTVKQSEADPCEYEITMMRPDCDQIACAKNVNGYLLDLRVLRKVANNLIVPQADGSQYIISLCSAARSCRDFSLAACTVTNKGDIVPLATKQTQHIVYDEVTKEITVRGKYRYGARSRVREVNVILKCNWSTTLATPKYIKPQTQGDKYKFTIESVHGCVKLPMNCKVNDLRNFKYDLSKLYKPNGYWKIANISNGQGMINICGPLSLPMGTGSDNFCTRSDSQICILHKNHTYQSKGSILKHLTALEDSVLEAEFTDGSQCNLNKSLSENTVVHFKCSGSEKGPIFRQNINCTSHIEWETPAACPYYEATGDKCRVLDNWNRRVVSVLTTKEDKIHNLPGNSVFRYNLCKPLANPCSGFSNTSACLTSNNKEFILGWYDTALKSRNAMLSLHWTGNACADGSKSEVNVAFVCDYLAENEGVRSVQVIKENCAFNITVRTLSACVSQDFRPCKVRHEGIEYDLSGLALATRNHVVKDDADPSLEYVLNVCHAVVVEADTLCRLNTGVCLRNLTEPNIKKRFVSLGDLTEPKIVDGNLVLESNGKLCRNSEFFKSTVSFLCSKNLESLKLSKKSRCAYDFVWYTSQVCGKSFTQKRAAAAPNCTLEDSSSGKTFNLSKIQNKRISILYRNDGSLLKINMCKDNYSICNKTDNCQLHQAKRQIYYPKGGDARLNMVLQQQCHNTVNFTVQVNFICNPSALLDTLDENPAENNCSITFNIQTALTCPPLENLTYPKVVISEASSETKTEQTSLRSVLPSKTIKTMKPERSYTHSNCCVAGYSNKTATFCLKQIIPLKVSTQKSVYAVNFTPKVKHCEGVICKDGLVSVPILKHCPKPEYNLTQSFVSLKFTAACETTEAGIFEIQLKCDPSGLKPRIVEENLCHVVLEYPTPDVCKLLEEISMNTSSSVAGILTGSLTSLLLLAIVVGVSRFVWNRCRTKNYDTIKSSKERIQVTYIKDLQV